MGELVVAGTVTGSGRYWCHMCGTAVSPVPVGVEIKCPYCSSGFLEEMEMDMESPGPAADNAISIWAPIMDSMALVGDPVRRRRSSNRRTVDELDLSRRRRRATAFLRLLQAIRERQLQRLESAATLGLEVATGEQGMGMALGDYFLGPGLDALMQQLSESEAGRQGTRPANKDAVEALPTVEVMDGNDAASCAVCLEDYTSREHARELPCRHRFHSQCIVPWLEMRSSCPVCRFQLPADNHPKTSCDAASTTTTYVTTTEAQGNSIQWLNTLFSHQGPSSTSTSTSASGSGSSSSSTSLHFED